VHARLEVPYLDASAEQLVWQLDAPLQSALAVGHVDWSWCTLELRLLGASHQVVVRGHDGAGCSELVACRPGGSDGLPEAVSDQRAGLHYRFDSSVVRVTAEALADQATALVDRLSGDAQALVGSFPGSPHAVTAVEVVASGWRTWHLYPQTGQIVTTVTQVERA